MARHTRPQTVLVVILLFRTTAAVARPPEQGAVKLHHPTYNVSRILHYKADGTRAEIDWKDDNGPTRIATFLSEHLDLTIDGSVAGLPGTLDDYSQSLASLAYKCMTIMHPSYPDWATVDAEEPCFVHADGISGSKADRVLLRCAEDSYYLMYPGPAWREHYASFVSQQLQEDDRLDGIFADVTLSTVDRHSSFWHLIREEMRIIADDGTIQIPDRIIHVDAGVWTCSEAIEIVKVFDVDGKQLEVASWDEHRVRLKQELRPNTGVFVSYYAVLPHLPDEVIASWTADMTETLRHVKNRLANKLLVFNEFSESEPEDDAWFDIVDGAMIEHFVHAPWDSAEWQIDEQRWRAQVDDLAKLSHHDIVLAQSGISDPPDEASIRQTGMFAFGSFVLGKGDLAYFNFAVAPGSYQKYVYFDAWGIELGQPLGDYRQQDGIDGGHVYERRFAKALVLVNPTEAAVAVRLGGSWATCWDARGMRVPATAVAEMAPKTAMIAHRR